MRQQPSFSTTMTAKGIGSRSSPIVIDDDDDVAQPSPITVSSGSSSSRSMTPLQESPGMVKAQDFIPAEPAESNRLKNNIGYSILVRMGYKPGHGLGTNLEGNRPLSASLWVVDLSLRGDKSRQGLY